MTIYFFHILITYTSEAGKNIVYENRKYTPTLYKIRHRLLSALNYRNHVKRLVIADLWEMWIEWLYLTYTLMY